uniref:Solute carrier family 22 member 3 n=1 Tax=Cyprinus carpio TaxID=7962 RepID=A0A8C2IUB0_CYPCA
MSLWLKCNLVAITACDWSVTARVFQILTSSGLLVSQLWVNTLPQFRGPLFTAVDAFRSSTTRHTLTMTTFEDILEEAGAFGRSQMRIVSIFCLVSIPFSFVYVGIVFQGFTPEHWCRDPGVSGIRERCGWSLQDARRATVPLMNSSAGVTYSQCQRLDMDWNTTGLTCDNPESELILAQHSILPMTGCTDGWEYDYEGRQSFVTEFDLVCADAWYVDMFQAALGVGFLVGSIAIGYLADKYGRMKSFVMTNFFIGVAGILVATSPNYIALLVFRVLFGFGVKGGWMVGYVLITELVGVEYRRMVGVTYQMFFSLGILILPLLAYFIPNWRWLQVVFTIPYICFLTYYWFIPESPRWLLSQNKRIEALEITKAIAKENKKTLSKNIETLTDENTESISTVSFMDLFKTSKLRKFTFILSFNWFTSAVVYQGLIMRLGILGGNVYVDFLISGIVELPAAFLILLTIERIGRRLPFAAANIVAGAACLITAFIPDSMFWLKSAVACVGRLGITMAFEMVVFVNTELYPTVIRNLGVSVCSTLCDIGGIIAPFLLYRLAVIWLELPLIIFGALAFVAGGLVLLLPETKGVPLPETIDDVDCPNRNKENQLKSQQLENLLPCDVTSNKEVTAV